MSRYAPVTLPILLTTLLGACAASGSSGDAAGADAPAVQEGHVDAGDGVQLFYRMVGSGGDTVVVIHGGPGFSMNYFGDHLAPLAEEFTLLFYDQRGTGRSTLVSDSTALSGAHFADDVEALRRHFSLERPTLLAHSWGAGVVALYAAQYPERAGRLIIVGGIPPQQGRLNEAFEALAAGRDTATVRQMREWRNARVADPTDVEACREYYQLWFQPFFGDPAVADRTDLDVCSDSPESMRNKMASVDRYVMAALGQWDWRPALRRVAAPALMIHGTADPLPLADAREWAASLPEARLLPLEGVGHFPYLEAPGPFFSAIREFLHGRWPAGSQVVSVP